MRIVASFGVPISPRARPCRRRLPDDQRNSVPSRCHHARGLGASSMVRARGVRANGFSQSTCLPAAIAASAIGAWVCGGVAIATASAPGRARASARSVRPSGPRIGRPARLSSPVRRRADQVEARRRQRAQGGDAAEPGTTITTPVTAPRGLSDRSRILGFARDSEVKLGGVGRRSCRERPVRVWVLRPAPPVSAARTRQIDQLLIRSGGSHRRWCPSPTRRVDRGYMEAPVGRACVHVPKGGIETASTSVPSRTTRSSRVKKWTSRTRGPRGVGIAA